MIVFYLGEMLYYLYVKLNTLKKRNGLTKQG